MTDVIRVNADELRAAGTGWGAEVFELAAAPPVSDLAGGWPTMLAAAAVTGTAQAATADLHARITTTAAATQAAAAGYEATDSDAVDALKDVLSTVTDAVRENT